MPDRQFTSADDGLHEPSGSFYENETFWYSFFVPERRLGGWLYTGVRQNAGVTHGGLWIWDDSGHLPWTTRFYEGFAHLKTPPSGSGDLSFATGMTIKVREPLMSYDLGYDDRDRVKVALRFDAVEEPVALRHGTPPYPKASHFDQMGRVTGEIILDGERVDVDCVAIRDRSWGPRPERGSQRVGYAWGGSENTSFLTYSAPTATSDDVHSGYLRREGDIRYIVRGQRSISRDPETLLPRMITVQAEDEDGRQITARGQALSHLILPGATVMTVCTALSWTVDGQTIVGEDQDVWPIKEWRSLANQG